MSFVRPGARRGWWAIACLPAILLAAAPSRAEPGRACTRAAIGSIDHLSRVRVLGVTGCAERAAAGRFTSPQEFDSCLAIKSANHLEGARERARQRLESRCIPKPAFGYSDAATLIEAAASWYLEVGEDVLGDLGASLLGADAGPLVNACRLQALIGIGDLRSVGLRGLASCVRRQDISASEWTSDFLTECTTEGLAVSERLSRVTEGLASRLAGECSGVEPNQAFPGTACAGSSSFEDAASCIAARSRCRMCRLTEVALSQALDCDRVDNGLADRSCPSAGSGCGNGTREGSEACDGGDLSGKTCQTLGFFAGELACTAECTLDAGDCSNCGDGIVGVGDECDGAAMAGQTCSSLGYGAGTLACTSECRFDTGACTTCGDGLVGGAEQCDGANLAGQTCASQGADGGVLGCNAGCRFDTTSCSYCGDGVVSSAEECDGDNMNGRTCESFGYLAGELSCTNQCAIDASLCFETCDASQRPPANLRFAPGDNLLLLGDSITGSFRERRDHYGKIVHKILGSSYCEFAAAFSLEAYGMRGSHYARYPRLLKRALVSIAPSPRRWIMFQDAGKSVSLANDRFQDAVRATAATAHADQPSAHLLFATTPAFEEDPDDHRGTCRYYGKQCNYTAHNDILVRELMPEVGAEAVPWAADFCRLVHQRPELGEIGLTSDGIHPEPIGNLGLALSLLKWAGVPREHLVLGDLADLHPAFDDVDQSERAADWIYSSSVYDCTRFVEQCAEPEEECAAYLSLRGL